jgi:hypothetical protein
VEPVAAEAGGAAVGRGAAPELHAHVEAEGGPDRALSPSVSMEVRWI